MTLGRSQNRASFILVGPHQSIIALGGGNKLRGIGQCRHEEAGEAILDGGLPLLTSI